MPAAPGARPLQFSSMSSKVQERRTPVILTISDLDDDDAFDTKDDNPDQMPYIFSPDAIREDLAKNLPEINGSWEEEPVEPFHQGEPFNSDDQNLSVSTLDIGPSVLPPSFSEELSENSTVASSHSQEFSQIPLSTSGDNELLSNDKGVWDGNSSAPHHRPPSLDLSRSRSPSPARRTGAFLQYSPSVSGTLSADSEFRSAGLSDQSQLSANIQSPSSIQSPGSETAASESISLPNMPTIPAVGAATAGSTLLTEKSFGHRPARSLGPSAFEKVRSKTRPTFLPPKSRKEDDKHMSDWQHMMKQSRVVAEKRRKILQDRQMAREKAIEMTLPVWEKEILPNWKVVHTNAELRRLWWRGIPSKLRAPLWEQAVGNDLALSKDHYRICLSRARRALQSGVFPQATLEQIELDVETTLPAIQIFHKEHGPMYNDLKDMLFAWVVSRSDEGLRYNMGAAKVAAMLLINMPAQQGFIVMRNLLERHLLRSFFGGERSKDDVEAYYRIFDTMLADGMPKIYFNFKQHQISPSAYLCDWIIPLFLDHLPFEACARIWDVVILEGDPFLYRASLGILAVLEPRLFFPDRKELLELLKGENKAAIEVAKREGRPLNGGKYEIYRLDEESLWERIYGMDEWWKDTTWRRLIHRELPDL